MTKSRGGGHEEEGKSVRKGALLLNPEHNLRTPLNLRTHLQHKLNRKFKFHILQHNIHPVTPPWLLLPHSASSSLLNIPYPPLQHTSNNDSFRASFKSFIHLPYASPMAPNFTTDRTRQVMPTTSASRLCPYIYPRTTRKFAFSA